MSEPNARKVERVAKAICRAAGSEVTKGGCAYCENSDMPMPCIWETFRGEAVAAIRAMKGF